MPGERQLTIPTEDPQPRIVRLALRRKDEGGLREVDLPRHPLHVVVGQARRLEEDRQLVPCQYPVGEDVQMQVGVPAVTDANAGA